MIEIVPYLPDLAPAFQRLNLDWIDRLFAVEAADRKVLADPGSAIIEPGGQIFFALDGDAAVGTVAMIRVDEGIFELAKMAVVMSHQKRGIGELLGRAAIDWARIEGARRVFLQTNSSLANSIRLYERLGFRHAVNPEPPDYVRSDVYMELPIESGGG